MTGTLARCQSDDVALRRPEQVRLGKDPMIANRESGNNLLKRVFPAPSLAVKSNATWQ